MLIDLNRYNQLLENIGIKLSNSCQRASQAINSELLLAKWEIGRDMVPVLAGGVCQICEGFIWSIQFGRHCLPN